jgi:two-component system, OmpR family, sensor kinase
MLRSIRWRLQFWYALVLLAVIGGFAGILLYQVRAARFREVDHGLDASIHYLDTSLRRLPPRGEPPHEPPEGRPPPEPDDDDFRPPPGPPDRERVLKELNLPPPPDRPGPDSPGPDPPRRYFAVWRPDGTVLKASDLPEGTEMPDPPERPPPPQALLRQRGPYREAIMLGPQRMAILVGQSIQHEQEELSAFTWMVLTASAIVLGIGLAGGWLVSARILRPIAAITATASRISAANLGERIEVQRVDRELTELADVLNETFARLQAAFERQVRFTADASHELRTPLAVLRSHAELALSRPRTTQEYQQAIEACLRAGVRMTELVEGLLILARADAGKLDLGREPFELQQVVSETIGSLQPLADTKKVRLTADLKPAWVRGDAGRLSQVFTNLLTNAISYNRAGGTVHVCLNSDDGEIEVKVIDSGPGISAADRPLLFERFYRVDKARSRASGGHGLGLAICKSIVEAHGGTIGFDTKLQHGTTFWVRLPRSKT